MKKKLIQLLVATTFLVVSFSFSVPAAPESVTVIETSSSPVVRADDIRWQYRSINGVPYRRLYNYTKKVPLTGWEKVSV